MILEYDELTAKLAQAEEDLQVARSRPQQPQQQGATAQQPAAQPPGDQKPAPKPTPQKPPPAQGDAATKRQASATVAKVPENQPPQKPEAKAEPSEKPAATVAEIPAAAKPDSTAETTKKPAESAASAPVVALVEDDAEGADAAPKTLENIDMEILMRIFELHLLPFGRLRPSWQSASQGRRAHLLPWRQWHSWHECRNRC